MPAFLSDGGEGMSLRTVLPFCLDGWGKTLFGKTVWQSAVYWDGLRTECRLPRSDGTRLPWYYVRPPNVRFWVVAIGGFSGLSDGKGLTY